MFVEPGLSSLFQTWKQLARRQGGCPRREVGSLEKGRTERTGRIVANFSRAPGRAGGYFARDWIAERITLPFILLKLHAVGPSLGIDLVCTGTSDRLTFTVTIGCRLCRIQVAVDPFM